jgi:hypothetical protein
VQTQDGELLNSRVVCLGFGFSPVADKVDGRVPALGDIASLVDVLPIRGGRQKPAVLDRLESFAHFEDTLIGPVCRVVPIEMDS